MKKNENRPHLASEEIIRSADAGGASAGGCVTGGRGAGVGRGCDAGVGSGGGGGSRSHGGDVRGEGGGAGGAACIGDARGVRRRVWKGLERAINYSQNVARWENVARAVYIKSQIVSVKASNLSLSSPSIGALDRFG